MLYTGCSIKEASCYFFSGSLICNGVSDKELGAKCSSVKLKPTSMIQNTLYFQNAICIVLHRRKTLK